jgi:hypothetical protein
MKVLTDTPFMAFLPDEPEIVRLDAVGLPLASKEGHAVRSYVELLRKIAALSYHNSRFQLLFRGQCKDYRMNLRGEPANRSSLFPSVLRPIAGPQRDLLLEGRFERLARAEALLAEELGDADVRKLRIVRWAILQHYEVCETPLLDVTLALQIALTFATSDPRSDEGYLYVFAVPQLTGPVSVSTESMTQTVDLSQVCPAEALRPHFQSGVLISDYPEYTNRHETHNKLGFLANSFGCRLLGKFHLLEAGNWRSEGFTPTPAGILFPDAHDTWHKATQTVRSKLDA